MSILICFIMHVHLYIFDVILNVSTSDLCNTSVSFPVFDGDALELISVRVLIKNKKFPVTCIYFLLYM